MRQQWEYCSTTNPNDFKRLGLDGWELVQVSTSDKLGCILAAYFKRPYIAPERDPAIWNTK